MNVNIRMLRDNKASVDDRLYSNEMKYLGLITEIDEENITLRNGIHSNTYKREFIYTI